MAGVDVSLYRLHGKRQAGTGVQKAELGTLSYKLKLKKSQMSSLSFVNKQLFGLHFSMFLPFH